MNHCPQNEQDATIILNNQDPTIIWNEEDSRKLNRSVDDGDTSLSPCPTPLPVGSMAKLWSMLRLSSFLGIFSKKGRSCNSLPRKNDPDSMHDQETKGNSLTKQESSLRLANQKYFISTSENLAKPNTMIMLYHTLDFHEGEQFIDEIKSVSCQKGQKWIINLTELTYCDSTTLGLLMMGHVIIRHLGGNDVIHMRKDSFVHGVIRQCKLDSIVTTELL